MDFSNVIIFCKTSSVLSGDAPVEGSAPGVDATACDATARVKYTGATSPQTITGLTNGTLYYFRIFAKDTRGNYTAYTSTQEVSATPNGVVNKAATSTLTSSIFNTGIVGGVAYNSIMWKGTLGAGSTGKVRFQLAASNSSTGPWNYIGGNTCGALDWFDPLGPNTPIELKGATCVSSWNNMQYFRYKIQMCSNDCVTAGANTPTVNDVTVNWAP